MLMCSECDHYLFTKDIFSAYNVCMYVPGGELGVAYYDCLCGHVQVVLCVVLAGGKLGVAYYEVETAHLYIMPDMAEAEDLSLMHRGQSQ